MDSVALLGNANWKLNMKRRELIKPDLNPPITRLCREEIKPTLKLFGDDLPKHMKDMSEATKVGKQMLKHSQDNRGSAQSLRGRYGCFRPYDRERSHSTKTSRTTAFLRLGPVSNQNLFSDKELRNKQQIS
jgi:hypothetical protein